MEGLYQHPPLWKRGSSLRQIVCLLHKFLFCLFDIISHLFSLWPEKLNFYLCFKENAKWAVFWSGTQCLKSKNVSLASFQILSTTGETLNKVHITLLNPLITQSMTLFRCLLLMLNILHSSLLFQLLTLNK